ncbi:MAG: hypothetical protein ACON4Q_09400, partial [Candidatus Puniceispirillaceae bacterium]
NSELASPLKVLMPLLIMIRTAFSFKALSILFRAVFAFIKKDRAKLSAYFDFFFLTFSVALCKSKGLTFSSVFLNGFAHVQHHFLLSSKFVDGENPTWYVSKDKDPIFDSLVVYDEMFFWLKKKKVEFAVVTGLSQAPYPTPEIYWRFRDHAKALKLVLPMSFKCAPKMTRDLHIEFESSDQAKVGLKYLKQAKIKVGKTIQPAFGFFDLEDNTLFCSFIYDGATDKVMLSGLLGSFSLEGYLVFVAIKNAGHITKGWSYFPENYDLGVIGDQANLTELRDVFLDNVASDHQAERVHYSK